MNWFTYALLCALLLATADVCAKKALGRVDEYLVAWGRLVCAAPLFVPLAPWREAAGLPARFWLIVLILLPFEITAIYLYNRAIKIADLSITAPFLGLTPLFLAATAFIVLGERLSFSGLAGIMLVVAGTYLLNVSRSKRGLLAPVAAIARNPGSRLMVIVALLYSITALLGKMAAQIAGPLLFAALYSIVVLFLLTPAALRTTNAAALKQAFRNPWFLLLGPCYGLMMLAHLNAIVLVEASYMIAVKRCSLLFAIMYGRLIFKEQGFGERISGGLVMVAGILCITLL
ncbi:MAG: EamA/RhaT family transporter [Deltaproteobacteria bacterium]|nr:EamA/RhaT family transporter [Deltaproteobacteria bacterium]